MKKILLGALALLFVMPVAAQDSEWGSEWGKAEERQKNVETMNFYRTSIKGEDWGMAAHYLHDLMSKVPGAHPMMYTLGIEMYKKRAAAETDATKKRVLADSLIMMHDKYIEYFGEKYSTHTYWYNRAFFTQQYFGDDKARVLEAFRKGAEMTGTKNPQMLVGYFGELTAAYLRNEVDADAYMAEYDKMEADLAQAGAEEQQRQVEKFFMDSGMANCENIEKIQSAKIDAAPGDTMLLDRTIALLNRADCHGEFYISVAEKLYKVQPTAMVARVIAASYKAKGDNATASKLLQEAIALAVTPREKVEVLLGIATDNMNENNFRGMYNHAHEAAQIDPQNVTANYLMAIATAGGASGCSGMAQRAAYWLAYDRMLETRRLATADSSTKPELMRDIENNIARFAAAFPAAQDLFLEGMNEGAAYTVSCGWVSGRTTIRRRP